MLDHLTSSLCSHSREQQGGGKEGQPLHNVGGGQLVGVPPLLPRIYAHMVN